MSLVTIYASLRNNLRYCVVSVKNVQKRNCATAATQSAEESKEQHQQQEQQQNQQREDDKYETHIQNKILEASLPFVLQHGWSKEALSAGAQSIGYPGIMHGMFTKGGADLITYFQQTSNAKVIEYLTKYKADPAHIDLTPAQLVEAACKERLQMQIPYLPKWPQALALMALPPNVPQALATLLTMVDDICYHVGDRSVDFSWYARRIGLAGIYKSSELYLMQDRSQDYTATWKFLNQRLTEAVYLQEVISNTGAVSQGATDAISSAFITARNILGLNKVA